MRLTTRRSMSEALRMADLSPEALALIKEGTPSPKTQPLALKLSQDHQPNQSGGIAREMAATQSAAESSRIFKQKADREKEPSSDIVRAGSVSLSVRVPSEIPNALVRAAAERK